MRRRFFRLKAEATRRLGKAEATRSWVWPLVLAMLCVAVLGTRVYVDFERVRVRLVTQDRSVEGTSVTIPLRDHAQLGGLPVAIILRVRAPQEGARFSIGLDRRLLTEANVAAGKESRIDTSIDPLPHDANAITISATAPGWTLTYLEAATVHGYAGPPVHLVIVPRARGVDRVLPWWTLLLLLVLLVAARPRLSWPAGRLRHVYRILAASVIILFVVALMARLVSPFSVLISFGTFLFGVVVLYAGPLWRLPVAFRRRFFPDRPQIPDPAPLPGWREVLLATAGITALIAVVLNVQVRNIGSVPDLGDPLFSMWRISWVLHQLANDPVHLFDANIFYPAPGTLTYSDSIILPALMAWPLLAAGVHPALAYNLLFLSGFVLSGTATYVLGRGFGWAPIGAWAAAAIFALYSFRIDHYSHLELQMAQWMPLAMLGVYRTMRAGGWRWAALAGAAVAAQWYSSMYYALFLSVYLAAFAGVFCLAWRWWRQFGAAVLAVVVGAGLALPLAVAYSRAQADRGGRPVEEVERLSATPADYLDPTARSALYADLDPQPGQSERQLFPGVVPVALGLAGLWPPLNVTRIAVLIGGVVAFDGSLGLNGLLYPWLYEYAFPFRSVRVPARFSMLVGLSLALLAGAGVNRWVAALDRDWRPALGIVVTLAIAIDAWPSLSLVPVWREPPSIYGALAGSDGAVLMEYPLDPDAAAFTENIPFMYFSIWHFTPMVNGYSGFSSPGYAELTRQMSDFPRGGALRTLHDLGVTHISVVCALDGTFGPFGVPESDPNKCAETIRQLDADPRVRPVVRTIWENAPALLYELER